MAASHQEVTQRGEVQGLEGDDTDWKDPRKVDWCSLDEKAAQCLHYCDWDNLPSALTVTIHKVIRNTKVKGQILFPFRLLQDIEQSTMFYSRSLLIVYLFN